MVHLTRARDYDGSADYSYISATNYQAASTGITIAAWVRPGVGSTTQKLVHLKSSSGTFNTVWLLEQLSTGRFQARVTYSTSGDLSQQTAALSIAADTWYFFAFRWDNAAGAWQDLVYAEDLSLLDDSKSGNQASGETVSYTSATQIEMGRLASLYSNAEVGSVYVVARSVTDAEIQVLMRGGLNALAIPNLDFAFDGHDLDLVEGAALTHVSSPPLTNGPRLLWSDEVDVVGVAVAGGIEQTTSPVTAPAAVVVAPALTLGGLALTLSPVAAPVAVVVAPAQTVGSIAQTLSPLAAPAAIVVAPAQTVGTTAHTLSPVTAPAAVVVAPAVTFGAITSTLSPVTAPAAVVVAPDQVISGGTIAQTLSPVTAPAAVVVAPSVTFGSVSLALSPLTAPAAVVVAPDQSIGGAGHDVFSGAWSTAAEFLAGDEWYVTLSGPAIVDPSVIVVVRFRG